MLVKFEYALVAAATSLQKCLSLSSTEAEYFALNVAAKTIVWLKGVLVESAVEQE